MAGDGVYDLSNPEFQGFLHVRRKRHITGCIAPFPSATLFQPLDDLPSRRNGRIGFTSGADGILF